ncbi:MAG: LLM class flavin-dependent oxidoreductase [Mycobacteriales bacterium]
MEIGIGLPSTLNVDGPAVVRWARRAEERGFARLATIDRVVYPSYDALTALAAAAGATTRIGLFPDILLAPLHPPVWLAKATGSLHALSGGRLTLGVGVGAREDDFAAMDRPFHQRGRLMDHTLDLLRRAWSGEPVAGGELPVSPAVPGDRVPILVGGNGDAAVRRTVTYGDGWTAGGGGPDQAAPMAEKIRQAWRDGGRDGAPRLAALAYYGLGDADASRASLRHYYGFLGGWAERIAESAVRTPQAARDTVRAFADAGITELVFDPTVPALDEVDRLADAVL